MTGNQTQQSAKAEIKVIKPRKTSWFSFCMSPNRAQVIEPGLMPLAEQVADQQSEPHAIGRRIPKSVDEGAAFGF